MLMRLPIPALKFVIALALLCPSIISPALISPAWAAKTDQPVDLELVMAVDVSGSVDQFEARLQRKGYVDALARPEVIAAIRRGILRSIAVAYFEWSGWDHQDMVMSWTVLHDRRSVRAFAAALADSPIGFGRYTSISAAIEFAVLMFENNGFEGTRRVIDISGDGPNNSGRLVTTARALALTAGITINGLPITGNRPNRWGLPMPDLDLYYKNCVVGGPGAFIVAAEDFKDFAVAIRRKLILEIAGVLPRKRARFYASSARVPMGSGIAIGHRQPRVANSPFASSALFPQSDESRRPALRCRRAADATAIPG